MSEHTYPPGIPTFYPSGTKIDVQSDQGRRDYQQWLIDQQPDHDHMPNSPIMTAHPITMPTMINRQPMPSKRTPSLITILLVVALVTLMIVALIEGAFFLLIMHGEL